MDPIAKCKPRNNGSPPLRFEDDRLQDDRFAERFWFLRVAQDDGKRDVLSSNATTFQRFSESSS